MKFQKIYDRALAEKGEEGLAAILLEPSSGSVLQSTPDASYLAEMAKCIFRSGFVWKIVDNKWASF